MRKLLAILFSVFLGGVSNAQFNTITFSPSSFTGDDSVTFTIDLSGTSLAGQSEVYLWMWSNKDAQPASQYPSKDAIFNNATGFGWGNSHPRLKMTNIGGDKWQFGFTGATLFELSPGQLKHFQFLVKTKTGSAQTGDSPKFEFAPVSYVPSVYRVFPSRASQNDVISVFFYQNLTTDLTEQRMSPKTITVKVYDMNEVQVGDAKTWNLKTVGNQLYSYSFLPSNEWTIPAGVKLKKFSYTINGAMLNTDGSTTTVSTTAKEEVFDELN